jgi:DNA-binding NtrC family response regulator
VLLDLVLPDGSGMDLFADSEATADTEIVLITGHASLETSIQALRVGAADYLIKPVNPKQLKGVLSRITRPGDLRAEITDLRGELDRLGRFGRLWGRSEAMRKICDQVARVAETSVTVLVAGESGTGKELVAQTIHELSRRRAQPFLAVNCGAIPRELLESEMFGHEKGSFTGAARQHRGYFERTHGGTLFLDEVTEMPLELQVKLLRVLETGRFLRVGSDQVMETDVRIVAATNRVPEEAVQAGKLREDLLYRLNVFPIRVPPLRERLEDLDLLAEHFLDEIGRSENRPKRFAPGALEQLKRHRWPGNVRELRNAVQRAYILAEGATVDVDCLALGEGAQGREGGPFLTVRVGSSIAEVERRLIYATLEQCAGRREQAAEMLGMSLKTLYNRLREYGAGDGAADAPTGPARAPEAERSSGGGHARPRRRDAR